MAYDNVKDDVKDNVIDQEEVFGSDIQLKPEFFIHNAIAKAQQSLADGGNEGFTKFVHLIHNAESLCHAANMVSDEYDNELDEWFKEKGYNKKQLQLADQVAIANKKMELLMREIFENKTVTGELKADPKVTKVRKPTEEPRSEAEDFNQQS